MNNIKKIIISFALLISTTANAIEIEITRGYNKPTKVAATEFQWYGAGSAPIDLSAIIENDLLTTGRYAAMDRNQMLSPIVGSAANVKYGEWRSQEYVIVGTLMKDGTSYVGAVELVDVAKQKRILGKTYTVNKNNLRKLAHIMADDVFEAISGLRGAFNTNIAYVQERKDNGKKIYELMRVDSDGQNANVLIRSSEPMMTPAWSRDAKYLAYTTFDYIGKSKVNILDLKSGKTQTVAAFQGINTSPSFSPDGKWLAFSSSRAGNPDIYIYEMATGKIKQITNHHKIDIEVEWTVDSQNVIFTSDRGGSPQIYKKNIHNGQWSRLTYEGSYNSSPQISSDGRYMIFVHKDDRGEFHIAALSLATKGMRILTSSQLDESPSLSPNGSMLVYATKERGKEVLAWVSVDGQVRKQMPGSDINVREPAWSPYLN
jgi:TolB protein